MSTESVVPSKLVEQIRGVETVNSDRSTQTSRKRHEKHHTDALKVKEASKHRTKGSVYTDDLDGMGENDSIGG